MRRPLAVEELRERDARRVVEAGADLACEVEGAVLAAEREEQSPDGIARSEQRQIADDRELLPRRALDLQPRPLAPARVPRPPLLGHDALETVRAGVPKDLLRITRRGRRKHDGRSFARLGH